MNTKQNPNRIKAFAAGLFVCLLALLLPLAVRAEAGGAVVVRYRQEGAAFRLYQVADRDGALSADFAGCGVTLPLESDSAATWQSAAQALERHVEETGAVCLRQGSVRDGLLRLEGLQDGLYLVLGEPATQDGQTYSPIPVLAWVAGAETTVDAKDETDPPETPEPTQTPEPAQTPEPPAQTPEPQPQPEPEPTAPAPGRLPQTGDAFAPLLWIVLALLAALGAAGLWFAKKKHTDQ